MISSYQKTSYGACVMGARFDETTYRSVLSLIPAAGYDDVSSFVRDAVLSKSKDIAVGVTGLISEKAEANSKKIIPLIK